MPANIGFPKSRILVVDDDEMLNALFCSFLEDKDFIAISALSLHEARAQLQTDNALDLMLLDYQLGDGLGMELLQQEAVATYKKRIPVVMISANESPDFLEECFAQGVNDYIIKPVNLSLLTLKVEALLKSIGMQKLIVEQKIKLEKFKNEAEREELVAKFTYEYLLSRYSPVCDGIGIWFKSLAAFSGDITFSCMSPNGSLYFMLADATGHGLSAAITIMPVLTIFHGMASKGFQVQQIVSEINRKLVSDTPADRFVAANVIEINPFRREVNVWNGGMPSVYWINKGVVLHEFKSLHMALGILEDNLFAANVETIRFPDEGFLFTFTDGLNEQVNTRGEPFTIARVLALVAQQPENLLDHLAATLKLHVGSGQYDDDVSVCVLEPERIFAGSSYIDLHASEAAGCYTAPFSWNIRLAGKNLALCDIPPLCNHFLQYVGCHQALCQKVYTIVAEMTTNAIDHGILQLSSALKDSPDGFVEYFAEREKRMQALQDKEFIILSLLWEGGEQKKLIIEVEDSGGGFSLSPDSSDQSYSVSGRGHSLIRALSQAVTIFPPGNKIQAIVQ